MTEDIQTSGQDVQQFEWNHHDTETQSQDIMDARDIRSKELTSTSHPKKEYPTPEPCRVLGVFGLSQRTTENQLKDIFGQYGTVERATLILDRATQISKCFGFVYMSGVDEAAKARDEVNGMTIDGRVIRVDYSITKEPHVPTPGQYLGKRFNSSYRRNDSYRGDRVSSRYGSRRYDDYSPRRRYRSPSYSRSPSRGRRYNRREYDDRSRSPSYSYSRSRSPDYHRRPYRRRHYEEAARRYSRSPPRD